MDPVMHFEIPATDRQKLAKFLQLKRSDGRAKCSARR